MCLLRCRGPGRARGLNPPLPVDEHGNWYRMEVGTDEEAAEEGSGADGDGLTAAERAILADIDDLK